MDTATSSQIEVFMNRFTVVAVSEQDTDDPGSSDDDETIDDAATSTNDGADSDLRMVIVAFCAFAAVCCVCGVAALAFTRRRFYAKVSQMKSEMTTSNATEMGRGAEPAEAKLEAEAEKDFNAAAKAFWLATIQTVKHLPLSLQLPR